MTLTPPQDIDAEEAVISSVLASPRALEEAGSVLDASDFYKPAHGHIYAAAVDCYAHGIAVDVTSVRGWLADHGLLDAVGGASTLVSLLARTAPTRNVGAHAARVIEVRARRRVIELCASATTEAMGGSESGDIVRRLAEDLAHISSPDLDADTSDVIEFREWMMKGADAQSDWVIPGVLRSDWRVMITAPPGAGKATLMRQMAYASAHGVHPFTGGSMTPIRTMIVDLENPVSAVHTTGRQMIRQIDQRRLVPHIPDGECLVWSRREGINIRERHDLAQLEGRIAAARPDLVCLGPVYKCFRKDSRLASDEITESVCAIFDDLRTRYNFALVLEHHSPRGSVEMVPFGSSVWERWPECGKTLIPVEGERELLRVGEFRRDRVEVVWPEFFRWDKGWPFRALYEPGARV